MAPMLRLLAEQAGFESILIATGQHLELFDDALRPFGLAPDHRLDLACDSGIPAVMADAIGISLLPLLKLLAPDLVLVQGDTSSAFAAACTADYLGIAIGHVEAGLRSHDPERPFPEETNRIAIDRLSQLLFAPTQGAMDNLAGDRQITGSRHLTGNSGIDALNLVLADLPPPPPPDPRSRILVTLHRRETTGAPLRAICGALRALAARGDIVISLPLHPNPLVRAILLDELADVATIALLAPLCYRDMIAQMKASRLILSDSGGVQEEAPALGVPLLILRDTTERPEAVACGGARLSGTDPGRITADATALLDDAAAHAAMARPRFPFGRGDASRKMFTVIENYFAGRIVT